MRNYSEITSKDNQIIKYVSKLQKSSKLRNSEEKFVIEGLRIVKDAFENDIVFDSLIVNKTFLSKFPNETEIFAQKSGNFYLVTDSLFERICDTETPQGIIVVAKIKNKTYSIDKNGRYIALDNLQDPSNLGAISRTCEALGISGIIMNNTTCDPFSPKSIRSSMGTLLRMPLFITDNISGFLISNNLRSFACVVDKSAKNLSDCSFCGGDVVIIGNEANGISKSVAEKSDYRITIPMNGKAESLNAAAAAAIAIYELTKR